jgi:hypothetical protein
MTGKDLARARKRNLFCRLLCTAIESALLLMPLVGAHAATGSLVIYDETLQNGNDCSNTGGQPGFPVRIGYVSIVHSGAKSIAVQNYAGVEFGWCPTLNYSIDSDYDGIDFWVNGGTDGGESVNLISGGCLVISIGRHCRQRLFVPLPTNTGSHARHPLKPPFYIPPAPVVRQPYFSVLGNSTNSLSDDLSHRPIRHFQNGLITQK